MSPGSACTRGRIITLCDSINPEHFHGMKISTLTCHHQWLPSISLPARHNGVAISYSHGTQKPRNRQSGVHNATTSTIFSVERISSEKGNTAGVGRPNKSPHCPSVRIDAVCSAQRVLRCGTGLHFCFPRSECLSTASMYAGSLCFESRVYYWRQSATRQLGANGVINGGGVL